MTTNAAPPDAQPRAARLPDFIIAGAMKCGTTSLRNVLAHHPRVFMPDLEVFYFTLDDIQQHPHFFGRVDGQWRHHDVEGRRDEYLNWYASFFAAARPDQLVGENSTSYLPSTRAPERIARLLPDAKIIVLLRDPVNRAYSHYWHLVRAGRTSATFEDALQFYSAQIVERSCYQHQLERLFRAIPRSQVHVIVFERFISQMDAVVRETLAFLGIDGAIDLTAINTRRNAGRYPKNLRLELLRNYWLGGPSEKAPTHLPDLGLPRRDQGGVRHAASQMLRRVNPRHSSTPPMAAATRAFLRRHFQVQNDRLAEVIGQDVNQYWWKDGR
jgi:hypothetical protein